MDNEEKKYFRDIKMALRKLSEIGVPVTPIIKAVMNAESELRESEDERIRQTLLDYFSKYSHICMWGNFTRDQIVAYLEKLKEQFWAPTDEQRHALGMVLKYSDPNDDSTKVLESLLDDLTKIANPKVAKWKEKRKEQKSVDEPFEEWIDGWYNEHHRDGYITMDEREFKNFCRGIKNMYQQRNVEPSDEELQRHQDELYDFKVFAAKQAKEHHISFVYDFEWNNFCAELLFYFNKKQKPADEKFPPLEGLDAIKAKYYDDGFKNGFDEGVASVKLAEWDDYTKTNLDRAIQIIKKAKGNLQGYQTDDGIYECDKAIEALEHFLYRGLEIEKPAEWSEEDKDKLEQCITIVSCWEGDYDMVKSPYSNFLKSLRPQPKEQDVEKYPEDKSFEDEWKDYYNNSLVSRLPMNKREVAKHFYWFAKKNAWKPSEEQMKELGKAKDMYMKSSSGIASLYYDLITKFK